MTANRFTLIKRALEPYIGQVLTVEQLRTLFTRHLGTSGTSVVQYLKLAQDMKLMVEVENLKFEIIEDLGI